jgi:pimeloyl-ACP methyl ester carboxylesterase
LHTVSVLETGDACIYYEESGSGPDVVWLAAGDQRGSVWRRYQIPAFDAQYHNVTYDARGVGDTTSTVAAPWPISDHATDIIRLIETRCTPPVALVGLSMGSLIAQEVSFTRPDLVRVAIVMGTCVRKTGFIREWEQAEIDFRRAGGTLSPQFALAHYAFLLYPASALGDDELWAKLRGLVAEDFSERDGEMLVAQWEACLEYDSTERLPHCQVPLHVIGFSEDVQTPPQRARKVAELAANGTFHLLEGLGHGSAFGHRPDVVNEQIRAILQEHSSENPTQARLP